MCSVLYIIICPYVLFHLPIVFLPFFYLRLVITSLVSSDFSCHLVMALHDDDDADFNIACIKSLFSIAVCISSIPWGNKCALFECKLNIILQYIANNTLQEYRSSSCNVLIIMFIKL
jgi:hypothetical protein